MKELMEAVREGRAHKVPGLLEPLGPAERKEVLAELKKFRAELRDWSWQRWEERSKASIAVLVAGAGCQPGAVAAATWIGAAQLRLGRAVPSKLILEVLAHRDDVWVGKVAHKLATRASTTADDVRLIEALVARSGCEIPTADGHVTGWVGMIARRGAQVIAAMGEDPRAAVLAPRIFELSRIPAAVLWEGFREPGDPWPAGIADLARRGLVERAALLDACTARILRGGRPGEMAFCLAVLRALEPDDTELRAGIPDWLGMVSDGTPMVAAYAQKALTGLEQRGELPEDALAAMSEAVLFRPEKALVRSQLTLVDRVLKRRPEAAERLLPVVGEAFGQPDTGLQERALKLVARHLKDVGATVREDLALAAERLSPAQREEARALLGGYGMAEDEPYQEALPPVVPPRAVEPAPTSVAELVERLLVVRWSGERALDFERVVDGMVRLGAEDRPALAAALREAMPERWWAAEPDGGTAGREHHFREEDPRLEFLMAVVATRLPFDVETLRKDGKDARCPSEALEALLSARLREIGYRLLTDPQPFLLATPTLDTGALDPLVLVERLREYGRLGAEPGPVDFGQALLRVRRGAGGVAAERAAELGTAEGDRLAAWLRGEGPELPALRTPSSGSGPAAGGDTGVVARMVLNPLRDVRELLTVKQSFPRPFHWLGREVRLHPWCRRMTQWQSFWRFALPYEREALAYWLRDGLDMCGIGESRGITAGLLAFAEAEADDGPAGPELHRALGIGLNAERSDDRLAAVDALLSLAAREQLDHARLAVELADLVDHGVVKPTRLADALDTAASGGAYGTVWSVLGPALPGLVRSVPGNRGLGRILAVAAECAERSRPAVAEEIPGLAELAGRKGTSQVAVQAARLARALSGTASPAVPVLADTIDQKST
ncbi:DUF6493 family protein [Streptomyces sp. NPDC006798]|uniref:DUF6493 family protein n=1 Tax=Streptomyces sp. NPDC006798 TaxID=3155462 RepID=UPI00340F5B5F